MNLDFKVPMSGKVARKLAYLKDLLPLDFDERILNHVDKDLLDFDQVQASLEGTRLPKGLTPKRQVICQYVADCDYRAVVGAVSREDALEMVMTCALGSGMPIAVLHTQQSIDWETSLNELNIKYDTELPNDDPSTANVVLVKTKTAFDALKRHGRDRIVIHIPHHHHGMFHSSGEELDVVKTRNRVELFHSVQDFSRDFPFLLTGFYLGRATEDDRIKMWCADARIIDLVSAVNVDRKIGKAITLDINGQHELKRIGFERTLPAQMAKLLNVNVDLLATNELFGLDYE